ncbi:MAG: substrate-binding domain-containing protein [Cellulomonadaceae bacterium]
MRKISRSLIALTAAGMLTLTACGGGGGGRGGDDATTGDDAGSGFPADATIGVSLPWLGTQNWAEAQEMFTADLTEAGFKPLVQAADNKVPQQQQQIEAMVEQGAKVIIVGPIDGNQLSSVLETAKAAGVYIYGYDRAIENTDAVDGVIQFGNIRTGELQGQSLLDGLEELKGEPPYNIELFGGGPADPNAPAFFEGAMNILQPKIDDGTLVVTSGQTDFQQAATQDWDNSKAQSRMDALLSANYSDQEVDGVLSPNDGIARAILTAVTQSGQADLPIVTGLDAENESLVSIAAGEQYSTVAKPTQELVTQAVEIVKALQKGEEPPAPTETANNGVKDVPVYLLDPVVVTKANAAEVFANDPERLALLEG